MQVEYKILNIVPNEKIDINANFNKWGISESDNKNTYQIIEDDNWINTSISQRRLYMQSINDYFTGDDFDYLAIFSSIKHKYISSKVKDKLINILHEQNFWDIKDVIDSKDELILQSQKIREKIRETFIKQIPNAENKIGSATTPESVIMSANDNSRNEKQNHSSKFSLLKTLITSFKFIRNLFQKNSSSEIIKTSESSNLPKPDRKKAIENFDKNIKRNINEVNCSDNTILHNNGINKNKNTIIK
ncbi:hypothetical protein [Spiroplasma sp. AdecLV25b]|uniref:hypothetical protein n=1 Tax=Spiroplasma sp. AdecLV25b TaxID=3027162 RepID=UPI0027DFF7F9|nr:hypothetical protein [Spiroplasma sp. AdecLV25b]